MVDDLDLKIYQERKKQFVIAFRANIGAGKTTLMNALAEEEFNSIILNSFRNNRHIAQQYTPLEEKLDEFTMKLLKEFYSLLEESQKTGEVSQALRDNALKTQINFLNDRMKRDDLMATIPGVVGIDRHVSDDPLFALVQYIQGVLDDQNYKVYCDNAAQVMKLIPRPDLYVYLRATVPKLQENIAHRGRPEERGLVEDSSYLEIVNKVHDDDYGKIVQPKMVINANELVLQQNKKPDQDYVQMAASTIARKIKDERLNWKYV